MGPINETGGWEMMIETNKTLVRHMFIHIFNRIMLISYSYTTVILYVCTGNRFVYRSITMATRGMMASNNFVGQSELLGWLNSALSLKLEKIEDVCDYAILLCMCTTQAVVVPWNQRPTN